MAKKKPARSSAKQSKKPMTSKATKAPAKKSAKKAARKPTKAASTKPSKPTVSAPAGEAKRAVELLAWSHQMTRKLADGFQSDKITFQPSPTDNHLMWQIGHLATTYSWFASMLDNGEVSLGEQFDKLFGYQSKPVADPAAYPAFADVQRVHDEQYTRLFSAVSTFKDAHVTQVPAKDSGGFIKNKVDLIHKAIWHEGWHQGQISALRRALSLPSAM